MFEKFLRKTVMKDLNREDQEVAMLLKDKFKMKYLANILIYFLILLPLVELIAVLIVCEHPLSVVVIECIIVLAYIIFALDFIYKFYEPIQIFRESVASTLYFSRYVIKGDAILKEDFDIIKKENKTLHMYIMQQRCKGFCYSVCFDLLKCLKKGALQFTAIRNVPSNKAKNEYSIHVLYVNNGWCFDTYSGRQYPLEEVMKRCNGKVYTTYYYKDVAGKTYNEFRAEHYTALKKWCEENDCYQEWMEE